MPPQTPAPSLSWLEVRPPPPWEFLGSGRGRSMWWAPAGTPPPGEVGPP